jgi:hypothetical protein
LVQFSTYSTYSTRLNHRKMLALFEFRVGQDVKSGQPAITRGLDRLDALCRGRTSDGIQAIKALAKAVRP